MRDLCEATIRLITSGHEKSNNRIIKSKFFKINFVIRQAIAILEVHFFLKSLAGSTWGKGKGLVLGAFKAIGRTLAWYQRFVDKAKNLSKYCYEDSHGMPPTIGITPADI